MLQTVQRCRDCAFFSLACEGLDLDRCRFFDRAISRLEALVKVKCTRYIIREEEKDVEFYIPNRRERKNAYEAEIRKYTVYMVLLVALGIGFFYIVTLVA